MSTRLHPEQDRGAAIERLAERSGGRAGLAGVLADLGDGGRRLWGGWAPGRCVERAWRFDVRDQLDVRWWPQGVDLDDAGRTALVTWYAKKLPGDDPKQGARLSVLDLVAGRYRHVLLVVPQPDGSVHPLDVHAGGLVWHDGWAHVAATGQGFWSARLDDVVRLPDDAPDLRDAAFGYRYVLPVRLLHRSRPDGFRYSFIAHDASGGGGLLGGEWNDSPDAVRRLFRASFPLDGAEVTEVGRGPRRMQGVADVDGRLWLSVSEGRRRRGSLYSQRVDRDDDGWRHHPAAVPMGNEDLTFRAGRLWTVTEHPMVRWLVRTTVAESGVR